MAGDAAGRIGQNGNAYFDEASISTSVSILRSRWITMLKECFSWLGGTE